MQFKLNKVIKFLLRKFFKSYFIFSADKIVYFDYPDTLTNYEMMALRKFVSACLSQIKVTAVDD